MGSGEGNKVCKAPAMPPCTLEAVSKCQPALLTTLPVVVISPTDLWVRKIRAAWDFGDCQVRCRTGGPWK